MSEWYVVRTHRGSEQRVSENLRRVTHGVLLPLMKCSAERRGRMVETVAPLFPCYLFTSFDLTELRNVSYTRGVRELVRFGTSLASVPAWVIREIAERCANGPLDIPRASFARGQRVKIVRGPLRDIEGVFLRRSGAERVCILMSVLGAEARAMLPKSSVLPLQ